IAIMKDGVIVQIGTPEEIVMNPADEYVREFVQGISKLKLVKAHSIMEPCGEFQHQPAFASAPRADAYADLDQLIDLSVAADTPVVITQGGQDVGMVSKARLLRGIQGGKE
ncbi:MAG: glycine/betaine ABC transporter, partial [Pseudomonadota bacterium]